MAALVTTPPPANKRTLAEAAETDLEPNSGPAPAPKSPSTPPPKPEPPNGIGLGVTTVHPMQRSVPLAFKTDASLTSPWTKPPRTSSPLAPTDTFILLLLDLSPSMAFRLSSWSCAEDDPCSAAAVVDLLKAFPAYLAETLSAEQIQCSTLAIAGFSGTVGWVDQDHCPFQSMLTIDSGNWVEAATFSKIEEQIVKLSDGPALEAYLAAWVAKTERIFKPTQDAERDEGRGTNIEAALYFAHEVVREYCNERGGSAQVFLATDGEATIGHKKGRDIRQTLDTVIFDDVPGYHAVPIQFHALMMGNDARPAMLTELMGSRGLLGYAKDSASIASGLDSIFRVPFVDGKGTMDMVTFVSFENSATGERVSERTMTCHSQGQFVGDNYTALYGACLPRRWRTEECNSELAASVVLRVVGFCAPNLLQFLYKRKQTTALMTPEDAMTTLLNDGHEVLLDKRLPLSLDRWWSPPSMQQEYIQTTTLDPVATQSRLYPCVLAKESSSDSIYMWVEKRESILKEINQRLSTSGSQTDAILTSRRYARIAESSGYSDIGTRCRAVCRASQDAALAEENEYQNSLGTSDNPDDPYTQAQFRSLSQRLHGSAGHYATAILSRATTSHDN